MSNNSVTDRRTPSIVARLMGMDSLPLQTKPSPTSIGRTNVTSNSNIGRSVYGNINPLQHRLQDNRLSGQRSIECFSEIDGLNLSSSISSSRSCRPKPREHPQEEELQKFKKEFEAWQSNITLRRTKSADLDYNFQLWTEEPKLAERRINKGKGAPSTVSVQNLVSERPVLHSVHREIFSNRKFQSDPSGIVTLGNRKKASGSQLSSIIESDEENSETPPQANIVILKPGFIDFDNVRRSSFCSPDMVEGESCMDSFLEEVKQRLSIEIHGRHGDDECMSCDTPDDLYAEGLRGHCCSPEIIERENNNMDAFLEEVKERLTMKIHGIARLEASASSSRFDKLYGEKPNYANQIARGVFRGFETMIGSSGLNIYCKDDPRSDNYSSLDSINRDCRDFVSKGFAGNVDEHVGIAITNGRVIPSSIESESRRVKFIPRSYLKIRVKRNHLNDKRNLVESITGSFRNEEKNGTGIPEDLSPSNLVRSLSAPISGVAIEKLISEDPGVCPWKWSEMTEGTYETASRNRTDGFHLKGKILNLRHALALKNRFFSKKVPNAREPPPPKSALLNVSMTGTSDLMDLDTPQDNLTEVPPSPASISSCSLEDFGKPSPVSPLELPFNEGRFSPQSTKAIVSHITGEYPIQNVVSKEKVNESSSTYDDNDDAVAEVSSQDKAYIRDVLVIAGVYGRGSLGSTLSRWKMLSQPIPTWVFEEVEQSHKNCDRTNSGDFVSKGIINRKLWFDLLNEALPSLVRVRPTFNISDMKLFRRNIPNLHGKKLLHDVWQEILTNTQILDDKPFSLDRIVEQELAKSRWLAALCNEMEQTYIAVEFMILEQFLDELVLDLTPVTS